MLLWFTNLFDNIMALDKWKKYTFVIVKEHDIHCEPKFCKFKLLGKLIV